MHQGDTPQQEPATIRITRDRLAAYLDSFTMNFLRGASPSAVDVEVLRADLGDQFPICGARLLGLAYDAHNNALEIHMDSGDHRVYQAGEVWGVEEPDGYLSATLVVCQDGSRAIVSAKRVGLRRTLETER